MSLRKKIIIAAAAVLVLSLGAYSTLAYLTADITAHNVITAGNVTITLLDKTRDGSAEGAAVDSLRNFTDAYPNGLAVLPGGEASKVVAVRKAADSADCWVRVRLGQRLTVADGSEMPLADYQDKITLNLDTANWRDGGDGWYYYNTPLTDANALTTNLLDGLEFEGPDMGNEFKNSSYTITVQAQATQWRNNNAGGPAANSWPVG